MVSGVGDDGVVCSVKGYITDSELLCLPSVKAKGPDLPRCWTGEDPLHTDPQQALLAKLRCTLCLALVFWQKTTDS